MDSKENKNNRGHKRSVDDNPILTESSSDNETTSSVIHKSNNSTKDGTKSKGEAKFCGVCGDTALGYNFNAVTCESCKAFFRRNALKNKEFTCPFENKCKVDVVTRRFCQKCRLKKCFDIGMKKEWIMTEEEKKVKRKKIEENRIKRHAARAAVGTGQKAKRIKSLPTSPLSANAASSGRTNSENIKPQAVVTGVPQQHIVMSQSDSDGSNTAFGAMSPANHLPLQPTVGVNSQVIEDPASVASQDVDSATSPVADLPGEKQSLRDGCHSSSSIGGESFMLKYKNSILAQELAAVQSPPPVPPTSVTAAAALDGVVSKSEYSSTIMQADVMSPSTSSSFQDEVCTSVMQMATGRVSMPLNSNEELQMAPSSSLSGSNNQEDKTNDASSDAGGNSDLKPPAGLLPFGKEAQEVINIEIAVRFAGVFMNSFIANRKELSLEEQRKLDELTDANEVMKMPLTVGITDESLLDVINLTDHAIRRLIKMSKKLTGFKNLCQDCQIALLKGSCTELMILRSVMSYVPEEDCWQGPKMKAIKVQVLKQARGNVYEEHKRFLNSFEASWRTDENIMLLLSAITLFTPERPNVAHKDVIRLEQVAYYYLLRRYLEVVYSDCEAQTVFIKLIHNIQWLHNLNENHVRVFMDLNPKDVEPLLIEIFDLKHC